MAKLEATWSISLDCECPHCKEDVDLFEYCDFWDGVSFQACETMTKATQDVEVHCPKCEKDFTVDFTY